MNWRPLPRELEGGGRGSGANAGEPGLAEYECGTYPACSIHGAMTAIGGGKWRCLAPECNIGVEWSHRG